MTGRRMGAWPSFLLGWMLAAGGCGSVSAMAPTAVVVEIAAGAADVALASCRGLQVRRGEVRFAGTAAKWLVHRREKRRNWHAPRALRQLEDVHLVLLLRSPESCEVILSNRALGLLPFAWRRQTQAGLRIWRMDADRFCVVGRVAACIEPRNHRVLPVPFSGRAPLRLYHHGHLELLVGRHPPQVRDVGVDSAVHIHLEGPGDEVRFRFRTERSGSVVVERTPGNMPNLDMLLGRDEVDLQPRGMMDLRGGDTVLVVFRHKGGEPVELDAGFLFVPDSPLVCELMVDPVGQGAYRVEVVVLNDSEQPVFVLKPSAGTVDWFAGERLIAAARPAFLPETTSLAPGQRVRYATVLRPPDGLRPTVARMRVGLTTGMLRCTPFPRRSG